MDHHGVSRWRLSVGFGKQEFDDDDDVLESHNKKADQTLITQLLLQSISRSDRGK